MTDSSRFSRFKRQPTMRADDPNRRRHRNHRGRPADPKQDPIDFAELHDSDGTIWRLALLRAKMSGERFNSDYDADWRNLKLYAVGTALYKANFWLSWNTADRRVKKWLDARALGDLRAPLMAMVTHLLVYIGETQDGWQGLWHDEHYVIRRDASGNFTVALEQTARGRANAEALRKHRELVSRLKALQPGEVFHTFATLAELRAAAREGQVNATAPDHELGGYAVTLKVAK